MSKKSFETVSNFKLASVKNVLKYIHHAKRSAISIYDENTGVIPIGTKHVVAVFEKYRMEFEIAMKRDTLLMNDPSEEVRADIIPIQDLSKETVLKNYYKGADVPKLPINLPNMCDMDLRETFHPLLRQEIAEKTGKCVSRIWWGDPSHEPPCWPGHVAPWTQVCNPAGKQKHQFGMTFTDVMKLAFYRLLISRGIDPKKHVEIQDSVKETKKMMSRGLQNVDKAWERFLNTIPEQDRPNQTQSDQFVETPVLAEHDVVADDVGEAAGDTDAVSEAAGDTGALGEAAGDTGALCEVAGAVAECQEEPEEVIPGLVEHDGGVPGEDEQLGDADIVEMEFVDTTTAAEEDFAMDSDIF